jgi:hypothetical protein
MVPRKVRQYAEAMIARDSKIHVSDASRGILNCRNDLYAAKPVKEGLETQSVTRALYARSRSLSILYGLSKGKAGLALPLPLPHEATIMTRHELPIWKCTHHKGYLE